MNQLNANPYYRALSLPDSVTEFKFAKRRRFRFDYAWPDHKVALEVDGGVWTRGRHVRPVGYINDQEKMNLARELGWVVIHCQPQDLLTTKTINMIQSSIEKSP